MRRSIRRSRNRLFDVMKARSAVPWILRQRQRPGKAAHAKKHRSLQRHPRCVNVRRRQDSIERQYHEPDEHLFDDLPHGFPFRSFITVRGWQDLCWAILWRQLPEFCTSGLPSRLTRFLRGRSRSIFRSSSRPNSISQ